MYILFLLAFFIVVVTGYVRIFTPDIIRNGEPHTTETDNPESPACEAWEDVGNEIRQAIYDLFHRSGKRSTGNRSGHSFISDPPRSRRGRFPPKILKNTTRTRLSRLIFPKKSDKRVTREVKDTERRGSFLFLQHSVFFYQQVDDRFRDIPGVFSRSPYTFRYIV